MGKIKKIMKLRGLKPAGSWSEILSGHYSSAPLGVRFSGRECIKLWRKGFSLVEMMFGVFILLAVIIPALFSFINCMLLSRASRNLITAANDAQYVLEQIKNLPYNQIGYYTSHFDPSHFSNLKEEQITFPTVNLGADITEVKVKVSWTQRGHDTNTELSTLIAK